MPPQAYMSTMATLHPDERPTLDVSEQIARIEKMQHELQKLSAETLKITADMIHTSRMTKLEPLRLALGGVAGGAALFAAAAAFVKLLI